MAAPDPAYVRAYNNERDRHRNAVLRELAEAAERTATILRRAEDDPSRILTSEVRRVFTAAAEAYARAEAYDALSEVSFLTADPDAEAGR